MGADQFTCAGSTLAVFVVHLRALFVCVCVQHSRCLSIQPSGAVLTASSATVLELYQTLGGRLSQLSTGVMMCHWQIGTS